MIGSIGTYCGMKIIVQPPVKVKVKRSWKERLFSLPWNPFLSHKTEYRETLKDDEIFKSPNSFYMNQKTYEVFKSKIPNNAL